MISCEKQMQPRQSSSSGDFAIIIKMKIRIKPEVSEMMSTFRSIWIGLILPYANYLWSYDSRQREKIVIACISLNIAKRQLFLF